MAAYPSTRPTWRENDAKYTVEKCLPSFLHTIETEYLSQPNTLPQVNDNQHQEEEVMTLYAARENCGVETVPHIEEEPNDTGVSDDGQESDLYAIPTGEEVSVEVVSLPSTEEVDFTSISTPTSNPSSSSRSSKSRFVASVRAKYSQFAAFMRRLKRRS